MKYTGEFYSIDKRDYRIEIATPSAGADRAIKLSGTPFVSSVRGDGKTLYSPIRCGGATVGVLSDSYIFDFYTGQAKGVKVTLYEGEKVRWAGYVSPTIYDQGHDKPWEEISLDCVDGVAVLKDIPFRSESRGILTFADIIFQCLKESGCYRAFYISDNVQLTAGASEAVIERFRISASNFFDERKDMAQTDDDLAWSCYDTLYHLLQWLGYTLTVQGDEVFILDWDAVASGAAQYHRYSLEGDSLAAPSYVSLSFSKTITGADYAANGAKVSLDEVFNKVTVKDFFNTYDNLFPTFGDENFETNLTAPEDPWLIEQNPVTASGDYERVLFGDVIKADPNNGIAENFIFLADNSSRTGYSSFQFIKIMDSPVFTFHKYERAESRKDITADNKWTKGNFKYSDLLKNNGAFYLRYCGFNIEKFGELLYWFSFVDKEKWKAQSSVEKIDTIASLVNFSANPSDYNMKSIILLLNAGDYRFGPCDEKNYNDRTGTVDDITKNYPFVSLKDQSSSSIFGGVNHILRIQGKISYHAEPGTPHPLENSYSKNLKYDGDKKYGTQGYLWCKVKWGQQWWSDEGWKPEESWFKLYFWDPDETPSSWKNTEHYAKEFEICSNMKDNGILMGEKGYVITAPVNGNLEGTPEVAFTTRDMEGDSRRGHWGPKGTKFDNFSCRYFSECVFISDLEITAEVAPGLLSDADLDSDTLYTNVIDNGSVSPMEQIEFKVCTDDGKKPSYSSVDFLEGSQSRFVTTAYNKALRSRERGTEGADGLSDGALRQEEHMVFKTASHYESPRVVFECCLHNEDFPPYAVFYDASFGSRRFVLMECETDYRFNQSSIKITEKE